MVNPDKPAPKRRRKPASAPVAGPGSALPADGEDALTPARREKIARLKKAIEDGTYQVSSDEVARKVIEHMFEPKK